MSDQTESLVPDAPTPSIHDLGARATAVIEKANDMAQQLARALQVNDALLEMLDTEEVPLDTFRTDMRQCATISTEGNKYIARRRPRAPMGS